MRPQWVRFNSKSRLDCCLCRLRSVFSRQFPACECCNDYGYWVDTFERFGVLTAKVLVGMDTILYIPVSKLQIKS